MSYQKRTRGFDHQDEEPTYNIDDVTQDQFYIARKQDSNEQNNQRYKQHGHHSKNYSNNNNTNNNNNKYHNNQRYNNKEDSSMPVKIEKDSKSAVDSALYTDQAKYYDSLTNADISTKQRKDGRIYRLRNLNNWIKSVGINLAIHHAQDHICNLAREIGINPEVISIDTNAKSKYPRMLHSLFEMQQRADGIWEMDINPKYPLPIGTKIQLLNDSDDDVDENNNNDDENNNNENNNNDSEDNFIKIQQREILQTLYQTSLRKNEHYQLSLNQRHTLINSKFEQKQNIYCLDLCGGKGGDLFKFMENDVGGYVLADIALRSVEKAIGRYNEIAESKTQKPFLSQNEEQQQQLQQQQQNNKKDKYKRQEKLKKLFFAKFIAGNLCYHQLHDYLHPKISFDMVAISFAFHYAFETEATLRRMLQNISDRLRPGGLFVCTVPDSRVLMSKLKNTNDLKFNNDIYSIEFEPTPQLLSWLMIENPSTIHDYLFKLDPIQVCSKPSLLYWLAIHLPSHFPTYYKTLTSEQLKSYHEYETIQKQLNNNTTNNTTDNNENQNNIEIPSEIINNIDTHIETRNQSTFDPIFRRQKQPPSNPFHSFSPFGIEYRFTLTEAVEDVAEFVVLYPVLCQIAAEYGLKPILHQNLRTFVATQVKQEVGTNNHYELLRNMKVIQSCKELSPNPNDIQPFPLNEWEGVGVYCTMLFQKVGEIQFHGQTIYYDDISLTTDYNSNLDIIQQHQEQLNQQQQSQSQSSSQPSQLQLSNIFEKSNYQDESFQQCAYELTQMNLAIPPVINQFNRLSSIIHPDPLSAGSLTPNGTYWNQYQEPLTAVPVEDLINCFDAELYDQTFKPTL